MDKQYVLKKYKEMRIDFEDEIMFNTSINPDFQNIPKCQQCAIDFENFRNRQDKCDKMEIEWKHPNSCLWFDYFADKIKENIQKPKFVKKLKKK